jgi:ABC-2 type transport system permease protein
MTQASLRSRPGGYISSDQRMRFGPRIRRVYAYRRILGLLVMRDLKLRYAGSALGYLWSVLDPLLMSLVYWFVFTEIFQRKIGFEPYIVFLIAGQLPWYWINGGITAVSRALRSEAQMVRSTNVPRELWVVRVVISKGLEYVFSLPVLILFAVAYLRTPRIEALFMPVAMLMTAIFLTGVGLILAPMTVLVRDVDRIIPIVMRVLFYCTPILYSVTRIPRRLHIVESFNPIAGIVVAFRSAFFSEELYPTRVEKVRDPLGDVVRDSSGKAVTHTVHLASNWPLVLHSAIGCVVLFLLGMYVFAKLERPVLKEI